MAETKETKKGKEEVAKAPAAEVPTTIEGADGRVLDVSDLIAQMESAEVGIELTADYLKLEEGEEVRLIFVEMTTMNGMGEKKDQKIEAAKFIGMDKRFKIAADKVLVSTCAGIAAAGRAPKMISVTCVGWKGARGAEYRDLLIRELNPVK